MKKEIAAGEETKITTVALPENLVADLGVVAAQEHRSRNQQIVLFLRASVSRWETEHGIKLSVAAGAGV